MDEPDYSHGVEEFTMLNFFKRALGFERRDAIGIKLSEFEHKDRAFFVILSERGALSEVEWGGVERIYALAAAKVKRAFQFRWRGAADSFDSAPLNS